MREIVSGGWEIASGVNTSVRRDPAENPRADDRQNSRADDRRDRWVLGDRTWGARLHLRVGRLHLGQLGGDGGHLLAEQEPFAAACRKAKPGGLDEQCGGDRLQVVCGRKKSKHHVRHTDEINAKDGTTVVDTRTGRGRVCLLGHRTLDNGAEVLGPFRRGVHGCRSGSGRGRFGHAMVT